MPLAVVCPCVNCPLMDEAAEAEGESTPAGARTGRARLQPCRQSCEKKEPALAAEGLLGKPYNASLRCKLPLPPRYFLERDVPRLTAFARRGNRLRRKSAMSLCLKPTHATVKAYYETSASNSAASPSWAPPRGALPKNRRSGGCPAKNAIALASSFKAAESAVDESRPGAIRVAGPAGHP